MGFLRASAIFRNINKTVVSITTQMKCIILKNVVANNSIMYFKDKKNYQVTLSRKKIWRPSSHL